MKNVKTLCLLLITLSILSCSKSDDGGGSKAGEAKYNATINGGAFSNYNSTLGYYSPDFSTNGLTLAIVDADSNTIRMFLNNTGGFDSGVVKTMGDVASNGFITGVIIRNDASQAIYNSSDGNITITNHFVDSDSENDVISGSINVTAMTNTGTIVTISGTFENFQY